MGQTFHYCRECGAVHRTDATCLEGAEERRRAKKRDWSDTHAPSIQTDDNNPWRHHAEALGERAKTRAGVKQLEAEGVCMTSKADRELANSHRGRGAREKFQGALDKIRDGRRILVS